MRTTTSIAILKFTLSLLLLCFVICGCSGEVNEESSVNIESISKNEENEIYDESEEVSVETENEYTNYIIADENAVELELFAEIDLDEYCAVQMLLDDCILYAKEHYTPINEKNTAYTVDDEYFVYDIKTKEHKSIGTIYNPNTSSGDILFAPDGCVYTTWDAALFKIDIENVGITEVYSNDTGLPFQYISVLDDSHLVVFEPHQIEYGYKYKYTVTLYDLYTRETKVIFETNQIREEEGSIGEIISSARAYNGEIYCLMKEGEYRIDVINADGEFLRTIALDNDVIDEASSDGSRSYGIWDMIICDDVIWFETLADTIVPFSLSDGTAIGETLKCYLRDDFQNVERKSLLGKYDKSRAIFRRVDDKLVIYKLNCELKGSSIMSYSGDYIGIKYYVGDERYPAPSKLALYKIIYN